MYKRQREEQEVHLTTLADFNPEEVDMFTVILIGNSQSYAWNGKFITPRGYYNRPDKDEQPTKGIGQDIMIQSFRTIESELKNKNIPLDHKWALLHAIHTTADFEMEKLLYTDKGAVEKLYQKIADGALDVNETLDKYVEQQKRDNDTHDEIIYRSAEGYNLQAAQEESTSKEDVLVIDQNLKGLEFKLAKCCNPIYGDDVFGFVTVSGGIKIHRADCPNATQMRERFGYRIVKARWAGKSVGTQYPITLRVVGHDDIGIVTNITSIISKENGITLRSIGIDSNDGLFSGTLTVMVGDTGHLEALIKKLRTVKGVKQVSRN